MFKLSQEEIDKMKEEVKELKKKIDRLEWFIRINEYNANEHKVYEGSSDLHLNYDKPNNIDEIRWTNNKTPKQLEDEYNKNIKTLKERNKIIEEKGYIPSIIYEPPFECCKNCSNNPKNNKFASGFCCCDLPYKEMIIW